MARLLMFTTKFMETHYKINKMKIYILLISIVISLKSFAFGVCGDTTGGFYPLYDTTIGIAVYISDDMDVLADTCIMTRVATESLCSKFKWVGCDTSGFGSPNWEISSMYIPKKKQYINIKRKLFFIYGEGL